MTVVGVQALISSPLLPMETHRLIAAILSCGYLDAEYLLHLIAAYDLDLADLVDDVSDYRGTSRATANDLIGAAYERVAQEFLTRHGQVSRSPVHIDRVHGLDELHGLLTLVRQC